MGANEYHFVTRWRAEATAEEVFEVLDNPTDLVRWWPAVYLEVKEVEPSVFELLTKGRLPYTLRWRLRRLESRRPHGSSLEAWGDFEGQGLWTFTQDGRYVDITYDWRIKAEKPLLRYLSFLLKPIFSANHRWAMAQGEKSLKIEEGTGSPCRVSKRSFGQGLSQTVVSWSWLDIPPCGADDRLLSSALLGNRQATNHDPASHGQVGLPQGSIQFWDTTPATSSSERRRPH